MFIRTFIKTSDDLVYPFIMLILPTKRSSLKVMTLRLLLICISATPRTVPGMHWEPSKNLSGMNEQIWPLAMRSIFLVFFSVFGSGIKGLGTSHPQFRGERTLLNYSANQLENTALNS